MAQKYWRINRARQLLWRSRGKQTELLPEEVPNTVEDLNLPSIPNGKKCYVVVRYYRDSKWKSKRKSMYRVRPFVGGTTKMDTMFNLESALWHVCSPLYKKAKKGKFFYYVRRFNVYV